VGFSQSAQDWKVYMRGQDVKDVAQCANGYWVVTASGLLFYDDATGELVAREIENWEPSLYTSVICDGNGHVWVGHRDEGLARYDGQNWALDFGPANTTLRALDLAVDADNRLWVATLPDLEDCFGVPCGDPGGVWRYDGVNWVSTTDSIAATIGYDYTVTELQVAGDGNVWMREASYGLSSLRSAMIWRYDSLNWEPHPLDNAWTLDAHDFVADGDGGVWALRDNNTLGHLSGGVWNWIQLPADLVGIEPETAVLAMDGDDQLWIGSNDGGQMLSKYDGTTWTHYDAGNSGLENREILSLNAIGGEIWVGTPRGFTRFDRQMDWVSTETVNAPWGENVVRDLLPDGNGGFHVIADSIWNYGPLGWAENASYSIADVPRNGFGTFDAAGNLWIVARQDRMIHRWDGVNWTTFGEADLPFKPNWIVRGGLAASPDGKIWVSGFEPFAGAFLASFDGNSWESIDQTAFTESEPFTQLVVDKRGHVWLNGWEGLWRWNGKTFTEFKHELRLFEKRAWNLVYDAERDLLWFPVEGGLVRYDFRRMKYFPVEGLDCYFKGLTVDSKGRIWGYAPELHRIMVLDAHGHVLQEFDEENSPLFAGDEIHHIEFISDDLVAFASHDNGVMLLCNTDFIPDGTPFLINSEENPFTDLTLYPNPTTGHIYLHLGALDDRIVQVQICDFTGRYVQSITTDAPLQMLDLSDYATGAYFLDVETESGARYRKKVIKH
ncbi:MAG: T9SS type A sorting domain-containing protein, partial [Bacteroidota bacterium]